MVEIYIELSKDIVVCQRQPNLNSNCQLENVSQRKVKVLSTNDNNNKDNNNDAVALTLGTCTLNL